MANHSTATHVQHHFVDSDQQFDSAKLGMWIFLVTEILFFGGLFAAYIIYRAWYPELFTLASEELDTLWGGVNTIVLIGSSLTVAMAIKSAQLDQKKGIIINLGITIALACVFMVIKYFEYTHKFHLGIFPGEFYTYDGIDHEYYTPVEITGLYWHLVDIIWIFLFPLFYLID